MFKKILIANRGEIAIRIIRACRELGLTVCTIHSKVECEAPHVFLADESYLIESELPIEAYLNIEAIINVAEANNIDAIHPGYGFLSENSKFISKLRKTNIKFIGPDSTTVEMMGNKIEARKFVASIGVPVVPGSSEPCKSIDEVIEVSKETGYPLMLKASAGGGGKGMRIVQRENEIERAFNQASEEALKAFGDGSMYVEKLLLNPRHIEVQILCDHHGNKVHLHERECSIQRRHQKIIEEAPAKLDISLKQKIYEAAIKIATECKYKNAGTVEFLVEENDFYFLEMNTRLQVEHPVTEYITGIDIVKEQIKIAENLQLSFNQNDIECKGHAIECRINSEDPFNNFFPSTGKVNYLRTPKGANVRIDSGVMLESEISFDFDPMIAKLICYGNSRDEAIRTSLRALKEFVIVGALTNIPFLLELLKHDVFRTSNYDINFLRDHGEVVLNEINLHKISNEEVAAVLAAKLRSKGELLNITKVQSSNWGNCE